MGSWVRPFCLLLVLVSDFAIRTYSLCPCGLLFVSNSLLPVLKLQLGIFASFDYITAL